jgi:hypothetical protein
LYQHASFWWAVSPRTSQLNVFWLYVLKFDWLKNIPRSIKYCLQYYHGN